MTDRTRHVSMWDRAIVRQATVDAFRSSIRASRSRNPVMFIVEVGSLLTTAGLRPGARQRHGPRRCSPDRSPSGSGSRCSSPTSPRRWPKGRGKAQADTLRKTRTETMAHRLDASATATEPVPAASLRKGDVVRVSAGEFIPADGEIVEGVASVDESAITGESAPVIRESGGDRSAVTGGTRVLSDWHRRARHVRSRTHVPRSHDRARRGRERQKTPNEIALNILLAVLSLVFLLVVVTLAAVRALRRHVDPDSRAGRAAGVPDPDDHRRADLGDRHRRHGPARAAQRARDVGPRGRGRRRRRHAAARQDRHDHARQPPGGRVPPAARRRRARARRRRAARVAGRRDARGPVDRRARQGAATACAAASCAARGATFVPFTAQTRMSGVDLAGPATSARARPTRSRSLRAASTAGCVPAGARRARRAHRARRRHAARRRRRHARARRRST